MTFSWLIHAGACINISFLFITESLYGYDLFCLFASQWMVICVVSIFWLLRIILLWTFTCKCGCRCLFSFLVSISLRMELLDHTLTPYLAIWGTAHFFFKVTAPLYIPNISEDKVLFHYIFPMVVVICVLDYSHPGGLLREEVRFGGQEACWFSQLKVSKLRKPRHWNTLCYTLKFAHVISLQSSGHFRVGKPVVTILGGNSIRGRVFLHVTCCCYIWASPLLPSLQPWLTASEMWRGDWASLVAEGREPTWWCRRRRFNPWVGKIPCRRE